VALRDRQRFDPIVSSTTEMNRGCAELWKNSDRSDLYDKLPAMAVTLQKRRQIASNCPWRARGRHGRSQPRILTAATVKHIEKQIAANSYPVLPDLGGLREFYRCMDCHAVWAAKSIFDKIREDEVCGVYDHAMIWKPYT
jgi:hypothetical protein